MIRYMVYRYIVVSLIPEQSKLTHCTSASLEIIAKRCLAPLQLKWNAYHLKSCFDRVLNRIVILFHPPAQRVTRQYYTSECLLSMHYVPIECLALGLVVFSNIIIY